MSDKEEESLLDYLIRTYKETEDRWFRDSYKISAATYLTEKEHEKFLEAIES